MRHQTLTGIDTELDHKFNEYHAKNPHIFQEFCRLTLRAIDRGHRKMGAQMILEVMRWKTDFAGGDGFKINNNYAAYYSRLFEAKYPTHKGLFRTRAKRG